MRRNSGIIGKLQTIDLTSAGGVFDTFDNFNFRKNNKWPVVPKATVSLSTTSVDEGSSVVITVSTTDIDSGTTLYWSTNTVSGNITAGDFNDSVLTGSFTITNSSGTVTRTIKADGTNPETIEGPESFTISIRLNSTSGPILATTPTITINDTSTLITTVAISSFFDGMCAYLNQYMSEYRNPSFYFYSLDGSGTFINDGGGDMYDGGNYTYPWYAAGTPNNSQIAGSAANPLDYSLSTSSNTTDTDFVYRSLGYGTSPDRRPLTMLGYRSNPNRNIGFQKSGNSGADGGGTLASGILYNNTTLNTFTVHAFYRQTYNAGDPSHCDLYMLIGHTLWDSSFGTVFSYAHPVSGGGNGGYFYAGSTSRNIIAVTTLLSKSGGALVTSTECQTVVQNFTSRMKTYLGY